MITVIGAVVAFYASYEGVELAAKSIELTAPNFAEGGLVCR